MNTLLRIIGIVLLLALVAGFVYERFSQSRTENRFPPPGTLVSLGERDLHLNCVGSGSPTVVIEAGSGSWTIDWLGAQQLLSQHYRVCSYDRAGYGWSDPAPGERDARNINSDLHQLVERAGIERPFVLLAHSLGGLYARSYALTHPGEVAGLILVDSRHEDAAQRLPDEIVDQESEMRRIYAAARALAHIGLVRLVAPRVLPAADLSPAQAQAFWAQATQPGFFRTVSAEIDALPQVAERVGGETFDVPLVIVRQGLLDMFGEHPQADEAGTVWQRMQEDLLELSEQSVLLVADGSGHNVHLEQPEILVEAVEVLLDSIGGRPGRSENLE